MTSCMIAMSGGVDSAVSAYLATQEYQKTAGVTMCVWREGANDPSGISDDVNDAAAVCQQLGIAHHVCRLQEEFRSCVIANFIKEYQAGRTPNPCVDCNRAIKFGKLVPYAMEQGFEGLATGHYARTEQTAQGRTLLRCAKDETKDQTYMLYALPQSLLSRVYFPLGELKKTEVRDLAAQLHFPMAHKHDSQDICFVPDGDYAAFIRRNTQEPFACGEIRLADGTVLGTHEGIIHYTIGQRKGLGVAVGHPVYVVAKSASDNSVILGENEDLYSTRVVVREINLIPFDKLTSPLSLFAKARYSQRVTPARAEQTGEDELTVEFATPQRAITPGQSLVLYDGDYVIGGGKIAFST